MLRYSEASGRLARAGQVLSSICSDNVSTRCRVGVLAHHLPLVVGEYTHPTYSGGRCLARTALYDFGRHRSQRIVMLRYSEASGPLARIGQMLASTSA